MTRITSLLTVSLLGTSLLLSGCSTLPTRPIIDEAPSAKLDKNLQECGALAASHIANDAPVKNAMVSSALIGAAAGGIEDAWDGAVVGALLGGLFGAVQGKSEQANATAYQRDHIVRQCLSGRGHRVIG